MLGGKGFIFLRGGWERLGNAVESLCFEVGDVSDSKLVL